MNREILSKKAIVFHQNSDFVQDLMKSLTELGWSCAHQNKIDVARDIGVGFYILILDVDAEETIIDLVNGVYFSNPQRMAIVTVNAAHYEKNDWSKIEIYSNMIEVRHKLFSKAFRREQQGVESSTRLGA